MNMMANKSLAAVVGLVLLASAVLSSAISIEPFAPKSKTKQSIDLLKFSFTMTILDNLSVTIIEDRVEEILASAQSKKLDNQFPGTNVEVDVTVTPVKSTTYLGRRKLGPCEDKGLKGPDLEKCLRFTCKDLPKKTANQIECIKSCAKFRSGTPEYNKCVQNFYTTVILVGTISVCTTRTCLDNTSRRRLGDRGHRRRTQQLVDIRSVLIELEDLVHNVAAIQEAFDQDKELGGLVAQIDSEIEVVELLPDALSQPVSTFQTADNPVNLELDEPSESITLETADYVYGQLNVPRDVPTVECELEGNDGDASLYLRWGSLPWNDFDCGSDDIGSNEYCVVGNPQDGSLLFVLVYAFSAFSDAVLTCSQERPEFDISESVNIDLTQGEYDYGTLSVERSSFGVKCTLQGFNGDADLYLKWGVPPFESHDCASFDDGSNEECVVLNPKEKDEEVLFVLVYAYSTFTNIQLTCSTVSEVPDKEFQTLILSQTFGPFSILKQYAYEIYELDITGNDLGGVNCELSGDDGDGNLLLRWGSPPLDGNDCASFEADTTSEECEVQTRDGVSLLYVVVQAIQPFNNATLVCNPTRFTALASGVQSDSISIDIAFDYRLYQLTVTDSDTIRVECKLEGNDGDADLYLQWGSVPWDTYDCAGFNPGSNEFCEVVKPDDKSVLYVAVEANLPFNEASLTCTETSTGFPVLELSEPSEDITLTEVDSYVIYELNVTESDPPVVTCTLGGDNGDADIYLVWGLYSEEVACASLIPDTSNEECEVANPKDGSMLYIVVDAYAPFTNAKLTCAANEIPGLQPGDQKDINGLAEDVSEVFQLFTGSETSRVDCSLTGEDGDADLYLQWGRVPDPYGTTLPNDEYSCQSVKSGSNENCSVQGPKDGTTLYVLVHAYQALSGASLTCFEAGSTQTPPTSQPAVIPTTSPTLQPNVVPKTPTSPPSLEPTNLASASPSAYEYGDLCHHATKCDAGLFDRSEGILLSRTTERGCIDRCVRTRFVAEVMLGWMAWVCGGCR